MTQTIVICGHGPGISDAVARKFGKQSFKAAIVARNAGRLAEAASSLEEHGVKTKSFACDLGDTKAVTAMIAEVREKLGPIGVVHWNAYAGGAGDLLSSTRDELAAILDVSVHGLIAAVQASLADLKQHKGAVLITGGGLCNYDPKVDAMAVQWGSQGLAIGKAAQHKTAGLLHQRLASEGVYVGEVVVAGLVKGTAFDRGNATLEPAKIADEFWKLYEARSPASVTIG